MPTLTHTISVDAVLDELDCMQAAKLVDGYIPQIVNFKCAAYALADKLINKAEAYGIEAQEPVVLFVEKEDDWERGDPTIIEIVFSFLDDANAVWFRTMII